MDVKRLLLGIITPLLVTCLISADGWTEEKTSSPKTAESEIVAKVNEIPITKADMSVRLGPELFRNKMQGRTLSADEEKSLKKQIVETLIDRELLYQASLREGVSIDGAVIDGKISEMTKRYPSPEEYREQLKKLGMDESALRKDVHQVLHLQELIARKFEEKASIPEEEAKGFFDRHPEIFRQPEEIKASHILIKVEKDADKAVKDAARKKIEDIRKQLVDGKDFAETAKAHSEGPSNVNGGDLGYFGRGKMVKPFEDAAFILKTGDISDIVETPFGFHIIKVTDRKNERGKTFDEVKEQLMKEMRDDKMRKQINAYIEELRKEAKIEIFI